MKGTFIVEYAGQLITAQEADRREQQASTGFRYYFLHKNKRFWWVCTAFI